MIHIWLDESDKHGSYYSNFYGGILVVSEHRAEVLRRMTKIKEELGIVDEIKWQKVNAYHYEKYVKLVDELFEMGKAGMLKIRIFFRHNQFEPELTPEKRKEEYPILYYQFIKYAFGLVFANDTEGIRLYLDEIPLNQSDKQNFVSHLYSLNNDSEFKEKGIRFVDKGISEVDSKSHLPLQFMDVILGAICFKLNEKDKLKSDGDERPGKRTILKLKLYKYINQKIREIYPDFNIGISTPIKLESDRWFQVYRHWSFKPKHHVRNLTRTKRAKNSPAQPTLVSYALFT